MLYLEAYTSEKVAFIAGPEFGSWQGTLHVIKALYGLKSSGLAGMNVFPRYSAKWDLPMLPDPDHG
jgi:hypothetical protein